MVSGGMSCVKYLLFSFNLLCSLSGIVILVVAALIKATYYKYKDFMDDDVVTAPSVLIILGAIIFLFGFFGCCGAVRENNCMLITYATLLILVFAAELTVSYMAYLNRDDINQMAQKEFNASLANYNSDDGIRKSWNVLQNDLKCCGVNGPSDWKVVFNDTNLLPHTCCPELLSNSTEKCTTTSADLFKDGCIHAFEELVVDKAAVLGIVGIAIAAIQVTGVIAACTLARSIRREYETV